MDSSDDGFYRGITSLKQRKIELANRRALQSQEVNIGRRGLKNSYSNPTISNKYYVPSQNSGLDAFRQSTRESNVNKSRQTLNQNYMKGRPHLQQARDGYSSIEPTETMARRKNNQFNTNSQIFSPANELSPIGTRQFNTVMPTKGMKQPPKYHHLLNPGTLNLTDEQVRVINDMHNDILNVNLMQQQLTLQAQMTQLNPQLEQPFNYPDSKFSNTMAKPPRPLQSKKQRLKALLDQGQFIGDSSAPVTPAGQYFDRSQSWDYAPKRNVQRKINPIELWEYLTGRMLEQYDKSPINFKSITKSRGQILCLKWAKLARKMLAKNDGWSQVKIRKSPIESWKKLLLKANQLKYLRLSSNKAIIGVLKKKNEKTNALQIQGRWNKLIRGIGTTQYRWVRLVKGLIREGYVQPKSIYSLSKTDMMRGNRRLGVIGRWSTLIHGIKNKHQKRTKHQSMLLCGRWSRLSKKIIAKDNKLRSLNVNGRWRWLAGRLLDKSKPPNTLDQRWINLIKAAQKQGYIQKKPMQWTMLLAKKKTIKPMNMSRVVLANYKALIGGALLQHRRNMVLRQMNPSQKSLVLQYRWAQMTKTMINTRIRHVMLRHKYGWKIFTRRLLAKQYAKEKNQRDKKQRWKNFVITQKWRALLMGMQREGEITLDPFRNCKNLIASLKKKNQRASPKKGVGKQEKQNRWRTFVVTQRWRRLLMGLNNQKYIRLDPFKNVTNINQTLKAKQNDNGKKLTKDQEKKQRWRTFVVTQRWRRLLMAAHNKKYLRLDPLKNISNINTTLKANKFKNQSKDQEKKQRWRTFVVTQRWRTFLIGLHKEGEIVLDPFKNVSALRNTLKQKTKKVDNKKENKNTEKNNRWRTFVVTQRWRLLLMCLNNQRHIRLDPFKNISNINKTLKAKNSQAQNKTLEKQNRWRTFVVTQRWRLLLMCLNNQRYIRLDPFKNISNINKTLKAKKGTQVVQRGRDTVDQRWKRLVIAAAKDFDIKLNPLGDLKNVNSALKEKNQKLSALALQGRWNTLIRGILNPKPYRVNSFWKRLVIAAAKQKYLRLNPLRDISSVNKQLRSKNKKVNSMAIQGRWNILIRGVLNGPDRRRRPKTSINQRWNSLFSKYLASHPNWKSVVNEAKKITDLPPKQRRTWIYKYREMLAQDGHRNLTPMDRWEIITNKLMKKRATQDISWYGGFKVAKIKVLDASKKNFQIQLLRRWRILIHGQLKRYAKKKSLQNCVKWRKMAERMLCIYDDEFRSKRIDDRWLRLMIKYRGKYQKGWSSVAKAALKIRNKRTTLQCWQILVEKMQRQYKIGNPLLNSIMWKSRVQKKWNRLMMRFMKKHKLSGTAFYSKIQNISKLKPKRTTVDERWKILVTQLNRKYNFKGIQSVLIPNVNRLKIKKITVKDRGQLQQNIREEGGRARDISSGYGSSLEYLRSDPTVIEKTQELQQEVHQLRTKLFQKQELFDQKQFDLEIKLQKYDQEVELGKQRENKLMFFLYVLKEERQCPVTEVFEEYIKPIDTNRFTTDYGDDYRKVLKKIKKHTKYERMYNKAIKRMKLLNGNKEYMSDSCLYSRTNADEEVKIPSKRVRSIQSRKKVVNIKNQRLNRVVKIPTLNTAQLGNNSRILAANKGSGALGQQDFDKYFSSSEESQIKTRVKDIVFDPRQRKYLLDSLGIITTRNKWTSLNMSN